MNNQVDFQGTPSITLADWESRKRFAGFTDEDAKLLAGMRGNAEQYVDEVIDDLYTQFFAFDETKAFFGDDATTSRVRSMQRDYFLGLMSGEYGEEYLQDRMNIGRVHQRIGLEPRWYIGAYAFYVGSMLPKVLENTSASPEETTAGVSALMKLIMLDVELAIGAYASAREETISRQQSEIIELQRRSLLEMSTPVIKLWDQIVLLPLVGVVDTQRAQQIIEQLLKAIVETGAQVAIIDVTGVPVIDTSVAHHLIRTVAAARMLGGEVVITGFSPEAAQTLVTINVDLSGIKTRGTLQAGVAEALRLVGLTVVDRSPGERFFGEGAAGDGAA